MPRYYFDFSSGGSRGGDDVSLDLPDLEAAREELMAAMGEMNKDVPRTAARATSSAKSGTGLAGQCFA